MSSLVYSLPRNYHLREAAVWSLITILTFGIPIAVVIYYIVNKQRFSEDEKKGILHYIGFSASVVLYSLLIGVARLVIEALPNGQPFAVVILNGLASTILLIASIVAYFVQMVHHRKGNPYKVPFTFSFYRGPSDYVNNYGTVEGDSPVEQFLVYADEAIAHASSLGVRLDYSRKSIEDVENILLSLHAHLSSSVSPDKIGHFAASYGAYVGQTFIKITGKGEWTQATEELLRGARGVKVGEQLYTFPSKAYKMITNGKSDSILMFFESLVGKSEISEIVPESHEEEKLAITF